MSTHTPNVAVVHGDFKRPRSHDLAKARIKQIELARHLRQEATPASRQRGGR